jgi:hypothetical protein
MEVITVKSLAMQTWTVTSSTRACTPTAARLRRQLRRRLRRHGASRHGTADGIDNDGDGTTDEADEMIYYTLKGLHVECVGYNDPCGRTILNQTAAVRSATTACYPNAVLREPVRSVLSEHASVSRLR